MDEKGERWQRASAVRSSGLNLTSDSAAAHVKFRYTASKIPRFRRFITSVVPHYPETLYRPRSTSFTYAPGYIDKIGTKYVINNI